MPYLLTLLLTLLTSTCALAQNENALYATGSLVAYVDNATICIVISSPDTVAMERYVHADSYRRAPRRYENFQPISSVDRYDLRQVHRTVQELVARGWELIDTDFQRNTNPDAAFGNWHDILLYHFRVPPTSMPSTTSSVVAGGARPAVDPNWSSGSIKVSATHPLESVVLGEDADGRPTLEINSRKQTAAYVLTARGPLRTGVVADLREIRLEDGELYFFFERENGSFRYHFRPDIVDYQLVGARFRSKATCGLLEYNFFGAGGDRAQVTGFYRPEDCTGAEPPLSFSDYVDVNAIDLRDFTPGAYQVRPAGWTAPLPY